MRKSMILVTFAVFLIFGLFYLEPAQQTAKAQEQPAMTYTDDFSTDSVSWQYLGSAYRNQTGQNLVLTTSSVDQTGIVFFNAPIQGSFVANFSYKAGGGNTSFSWFAGYSPLKNDGLTMFFYKQKYPSTINYQESFGDNGVAGGRLGFNSGSIIPGYGIEFDGYQNPSYDFQNIVGRPQGDPSDSHIALIEDYVGDHLAYVNDQRVADNIWHRVSVEVQGSSVKVFVDQGLVLQWDGELYRTYDGFGFSGANGQIGGNWHIIDDFSITARNLKQPSLAITGISSSSDSSFKVKVNGNLTFSENGVSGAPVLLSYSITGGQSWQDLTFVYTGSDGSYSATWLPSVTGNYLLRAIYKGNEDYSGISKIINFAIEPCAEKSVFSVSSNSTLSELSFNSAIEELSFSVSGDSGTMGYVSACIPKSLISDISGLRVYLDSNQMEYAAQSQSDSWLLYFTYHHSSHLVMISLGSSPSSVPSPTNSPTQKLTLGPSSTLDNVQAENSTSVIIIFGLVIVALALGLLFTLRKLGNRNRMIKQSFL